MKEQIAQFRSFNRFYSTIIGLLDDHYLNSEFTLTEVRILYELNHAQGGITAKELIKLLKLDKGYLSRILLEFEKKRLICKERSTQDGRSTLLRLTENGKLVFKNLNTASELQAMQMLQSISGQDLIVLLENMNSIKEILVQVNTVP